MAGRHCRQRRSLVARALFVAVLAALVAATSAFVRMDKTVTVVIDGQPTAVHTFAGSVGATLARAGITVGPHDTISPNPAAPVRNHEVVVIHRGRQLRLTLDGWTQRLWVTADTVGGALGQLYIPLSGDYLSTPAAAHIPLSGMALTVRVAQRVVILVDDHAVELVTTSPTVAGLLSQAGVTLARTDQISVPLNSYPATGLVLRVTRFRFGHLYVDQPIPFRTLQRNDPSLLVGQTRVLQYGRPGVRVFDYLLIYRNGREIGRRLVVVMRGGLPIAQVEYVGSKPQPVVAVSYPSTSAGGLNWAAVAACESGGNPQAVSPGGLYYGLYQFSISSWDSVGGSGLPTAASPGEQLYRAELLYARQGAAAWPVCGHFLYS